MSHSDSGAVLCCATCLLTVHLPNNGGCEFSLPLSGTESLRRVIQLSSSGAPRRLREVGSAQCD